MSLFFHELDCTDCKIAQNKLMQQWKNYCNDPINNSILAEIQEAQNIDELRSICLFLHSLSVLLQYIDPVGRNYDYASYLEAVANAVRSNEFKLGGAEISLDDDEMINKYGLD